MDKLTITMTLKSPLITNGGYMTFDALLAALLFDQSGDFEEAHSAIPLRNTAGIWHGSAAVFAPLASERKSFIANLRADHDLDLDLLSKNTKGNAHTTIGPKRRRQFGPVANSYTMVAAKEVAWYAEGDGDAIQRLLAPLDFIGKRRASGFGEVAHVSVEAGDLDGLTGYFGDPLRPIPENLFTGDRNSLRVDAAWRPAYWHPANRAICYVPASDT